MFTISFHVMCYDWQVEKNQYTVVVNRQGKEQKRFAVSRESVAIRWLAILSGKGILEMVVDLQVFPVIAYYPHIL